jgi:glycosyltransferase involved in cell wall biosynthesis
MIVFHPGTQHSWQTARAFYEAGRLTCYATSILFDPDRFPYLLAKLPGPPGRAFLKEFSRFDAPGLAGAPIRTGGWYEWAERLARRTGAGRLAERLDAIGNTAFARDLASLAEARPEAGLWGYDNSSLELFETAGQRGSPLVLDATIAHRAHGDEVMRTLQDRWPAWFDRKVPAYDDRTRARTDRELALADRIVVGCKHAAATYAAHGPPGTAVKLRVVPYCWDDQLYGNYSAAELERRSELGRPVRFLFVGQLGARKGLPLLLEAMVRLPKDEATLTLVGGLAAPSAALAVYEGRFTHHPHVPRSRMPAIMAAHDVLVLPSFLEGSATTLLEGLASGLAIIQSEAAGSGATERCGVVLDKPDAEELAEAMRRPIVDRDLLATWQCEARKEAERYRFTAYAKAVLAVAEEISRSKAGGEPVETLSAKR